MDTVPPSTLYHEMANWLEMIPLGILLWGEIRENQMQILKHLREIVTLSEDSSLATGTVELGSCAADAAPCIVCVAAFSSWGRSVASAKRSPAAGGSPGQGGTFPRWFGCTAYRAPRPSSSGLVHGKGLQW